MTAVRILVLPFLSVVDVVLMLTMWAVIIRALISWVEPNPYNPIVRTLRTLTDPILRPFQRLQYRVLRGSTAVDLSPLFAILVIYAIRIFLTQIRMAILY